MLTPLVSILFCAIKPFTLSARSESTGSGGRVEPQKAFILKYLTAVYGEKLTSFRFHADMKMIAIILNRKLYLFSNLFKDVFIFL